MSEVDTSDADAVEPLVEVVVVLNRGLRIETAFWTVVNIGTNSSAYTATCERYPSKSCTCLITVSLNSFAIDPTLTVKALAEIDSALNFVDIVPNDSLRVEVGEGKN